MDSLKTMILGVQQYSFTDDKSQREIKGTTVHYIQLTHTDEADKIGYFPTKATLPYEAINQFRGQSFPLLADASISFDLSNKRNPIKVTAFKVTENVIVN